MTTPHLAWGRTLQPEGQGDWVPGDFAPVLIEGDPEIALLLLHDGSQGEPSVGFARGRPSTFEVTMDAFESIHVVSGRATVEVDGTVVQLLPGVATTFFPGQVVRWEIEEELTEFFVMSDPEVPER